MESKDSVPGIAPRIALIVDNPYRDLPGLILVGRSLALRGACVYLVPLNLQGPEIAALAPDLVLVNYLRRNNESSVRAYMEAGIEIAVLDTEGGVFSPIPTHALRASHESLEKQCEGKLPVWEKYALSMAQDASVRNKVACYCAWTREFADYFGSDGRFPADRICVTGTPRTDFYVEPWRSAARRLAEDVVQLPRPIVLFNGTFPLANPRFQSREREVAQLIAEFDYAPEFVHDWLDAQDQALDAMTRLANELAARFPDAQFVVRPHPFEGTEIYSERLDRRSNLHLIKQGTVDNWLLNASAMIHWGSSTAVEAALAGVPVFSPGWIREHLPIPVVDELSRRAATPEELGDLLEPLIRGEKQSPRAAKLDARQAASQVFGTVDGSAHSRIAQHLLAAVANRRGRLRVERCTALARQSAPDRAEWATRTARWQESEKAFSAQRVESILRAIEAADGADTHATRARQVRDLSDYRTELFTGCSIRIDAPGSLQLEPSEFDVRQGLGRALELEQIGDLSAAENALADLLQSAPSSAWAWMTAAQYFSRRGVTEVAHRAHATALHLDPNLCGPADARTAGLGATASDDRASPRGAGFESSSKRSVARRILDRLRLDGRVAAVVGAAGHIGREAAHALAELGARIAVIDLDPVATKTLAEQLGTAEGIEAASFALDLRDRARITSVAEQVVERWGRLDVLVNCAAMVSSSDRAGWCSSFETQALDPWQEALDVNLSSIFLLTQALTPALRASGHGSVINMASIYGMVGADLSLYEGTRMGQPAAYAASKGAIIQFSRWLATVLAPDIRVNSISARGDPARSARRVPAALRGAHTLGKDGARGRCDRGYRIPGQ